MLKDRAARCSRSRIDVPAAAPRKTSPGENFARLLDERRFFNEARAVNAINHPGVVQVSDVGKAPDGSLYLVMEFLEGETLSERLAHSRGRLTEDEAVTISWQLAGVLAAAHAKSIIHRDIKPGNVMLVPDMAGPSGERVKLLDFGIAKLGSEHFHGEQGEEVKTRTGQVMGTASYMSPEQFGGEKPVDGQSDVYSLGVVMYRLLAGRLPFVSHSGEMAIAAMHMFKPPQPLRALAPTVSEWLQALVDSMLAKEPTERPTMQQVTARLHEYLPFRSTSRTNLTPLGGVEKPISLSSVDPTIAAGEAGPDKAAGTAVVAPPDGSPAGISHSGTITRATGQVSTVAGVLKRRTLLYIAGASLIIAAVGGGFILRQSSTAARPQPQPTTVETPAEKAPEKPGEKAVEKTAEKTSEKPGDKPAPAGEPRASSPTKLESPSSQSQTEKSGRRGHKTDGRKDGKPRKSGKPQSTQIIN